MNPQRLTQQLFIVGDCSPTETYFFSQEFIHLMQQHDWSILNLEGAFSDMQAPLLKAGPHLLLDKQFFLPFAKLFNIVSLANNHCMDFGTEGLKTTINFCKELGVATVGAGLNQQEAFSPLVLGPTKFFAVAEHEFGGADEQTPGIATTDRPLALFKGIQSAKKSGHFVIILAHGGSEVIPIPPPYLRDRYRLWIEYGADLVIGSHPHVVQGRETYQGKRIYYSLGNFAFPGQDFSQYQNSNWSLGLSINPATEEITEYPIISPENRITISTDPYFKDQFEALSAALQDERQYRELYNQIAGSLFTRWYSRLTPQSLPDAALLLHYLRCDAHSSMVTTTLSSLLGENKSKNTATDDWCLMQRGDSDALWLFGQKTCPQTNLDEYARLMQMSAPEAVYLAEMIAGKNYLEIGMGYSTLYFSSHADTIVSVESRAPWYTSIRCLLDFHGITNVTAMLIPPEDSAYTAEGNERWLTRIQPSGAVSDYGLADEFSGYLQGIAEILNSRTFDIILVDGNVRKEIIELLIENRFSGDILLHDVSSDRAYLNDPILELPSLTIITRVDSLVHLRYSAPVVHIVQNESPSEELLLFESDWLASSPYFYNQYTGQHAPNVNDVIDHDNLQLHPEGFLNYLDFGYSVFEQTPICGVKFLPPSARLYQSANGSLRVEKLPDPVIPYLGKQTDPVDLLDRLVGQVRNWEQSVSGPIIIPTSGGYDSRLLNLLIQDKSRIASYSYGISKNQFDSCEVVKAQELSRILGTSWKRIHLGTFNRFIHRWYELFGIATHAHGMYHFEFYDAIAEEQPSGTSLLSGIVGDLWAGCSLPCPSCPEELALLGYSHGLRLEPACGRITSDYPLCLEYWERHRELLQDPAYRVVAMVRNKMILLTYLMKLPQLSGFVPWTPFLDIETAMGMLTLPQTMRCNRVWQKAIFSANGIDLEERGLNCTDSNYLDIEAARSAELPDLDQNLIKHLVSPDVENMITAINSKASKHKLSDQQILTCYTAYTMLAPLSFLLQGREITT